VVGNYTSLDEFRNLILALIGVPQKKKPF